MTGANQQYSNSSHISNIRSEATQGFNASINALASSLQHEPQSIHSSIGAHLMDSGLSESTGEYERNTYDDDINEDDEAPEDMGTGIGSYEVADNPTKEQLQKAYYEKGLQLLENLQLLDLSPLANWKLSSYKQDFGLSQLRNDSSNTYWQSDGSNGPNTSNASNNQLANPHSITIQFSKKVSLERISIFTNYSADESYTPSKIQILAGNSDGWDLSEVCTVNFNRPIGWSHIIFNAIRRDGVLKCFVVKIVILANHQDGKDTRIRALRCYGKKTASKKLLSAEDTTEFAGEILRDLSLSGWEGNHILVDHLGLLEGPASSFQREEDSISQLVYPDTATEIMEKDTKKILDNVSEVIGFNSGFRSINLSSVSSLR